MSALSKYIKNIRSKGQRVFTTKNALNALSTSERNLYKSISRLKTKGELTSPIKGLYVIIPPENLLLGCIPESELIPLLMEHLHIEYYVALLSAAKYHGASHQTPMEFQIITDKRLRDINCGDVRIVFIYKKSLTDLPTMNFPSKTGYIKVSSPEVTAMDLFIYSDRVVGLNNIATILSELIEKIDPKRLIEIANIYKQKAWVQRLGYILEHIETMEEEKRIALLKVLEGYLGKKKLVYIPLSAKNSIKGAERNNKWMIIENTTIDSDL